jgi:Tol biopolymer transport system component
MTLWRVPFQGGTPEPLTIGAGEDTEPGISRDGKNLIYTHTRLSRTLAVLNPATKAIRELRQWQNQLVGPRFSPDGSKIAFFSHESGGEIHLSTIDSDGSNLIRRTWGKGERNTMPQWSGDGATLYFYQRRPTTSFRKIPLGGATSVEVVDGWKWENEFAAQVDPGGKFAIYARMADLLPAATVVHDLESGEEFNLPQALNTPRLSRDGKLIAGVERPLGTREGDIYTCTVNPGPCEKLTIGYNPVWSSDASTIYFLRTGHVLDGAELWTISRKTRKETHIDNLRPLFAIGQMFDVSPQGEVVFVRFDSGAHELWLADLSAR